MSLNEAINIIVNSELDKRKYDMTITAKIISLDDKDKSHYIVESDSMRFSAYTQDNDTSRYRVDNTVNVLIPSGDYNNKKIILGKYSGMEEIPEISDVLHPSEGFAAARYVDSFVLDNNVYKPTSTDHLTGRAHFFSTKENKKTLYVKLHTGIQSSIEDFVILVTLNNKYSISWFSKDMIGNISNMSGVFLQETLLTSELLQSINEINNILIQVYQYTEDTKKYDNDITANEAAVKLSNISFALGYLKKDLIDGTYIYTADDDYTYTGDSKDIYAFAIKDKEFIYDDGESFRWFLYTEGYVNPNLYMLVNEENYNIYFDFNNDEEFNNDDIISLKENDTLWKEFFFKDANDEFKAFPTKQDFEYYVEKQLNTNEKLNYPIYTLDKVISHEDNKILWKEIEHSNPFPLHADKNTSTLKVIYTKNNEVISLTTKLFENTAYGTLESGSTGTLLLSTDSKYCPIYDNYGHMIGHPTKIVAASRGDNQNFDTEKEKYITWKFDLNNQIKFPYSIVEVKKDDESSVHLWSPILPSNCTIYDTNYNKLHDFNVYNLGGEKVGTYTIDLNKYFKLEISGINQKYSWESSDREWGIKIEDYGITVTYLIEGSLSDGDYFTVTALADLTTLSGFAYVTQEIAEGAAASSISFTFESDFILNQNNKLIAFTHTKTIPDELKAIHKGNIDFTLGFGDNSGTGYSFNIIDVTEGATSPYFDREALKGPKTYEAILHSNNGRIDLSEYADRIKWTWMYEDIHSTNIQDENGKIINYKLLKFSDDNKTEDFYYQIINYSQKNDGVYIQDKSGEYVLQENFTTENWDNDKIYYTKKSTPIGLLCKIEYNNSGNYNYHILVATLTGLMLEDNRVVNLKAFYPIGIINPNGTITGMRGATYGIYDTFGNLVTYNDKNINYLLKIKNEYKKIIDLQAYEFNSDLSTSISNKNIFDYNTENIDYNRDGKISIDDAIKILNVTQEEWESLFIPYYYSEDGVLTQYTYENREELCNYLSYRILFGQLEYPLYNEKGELIDDYDYLLIYYSNFPKIYSNTPMTLKLQTDNNDILGIPIIMILNTWFSDTINAWNEKLKINEEDNYILASMIGAGSKNLNNQFTGVIMGKVGLDIRNAEDGIYGFKDGKRTFSVSAETGDAYFNGNIESGSGSIANWEIQKDFMQKLFTDNSSNLFDGYRIVIGTGGTTSNDSKAKDAIMRVSTWRYVNPLIGSYEELEYPFILYKNGSIEITKGTITSSSPGWNLTTPSGSDEFVTLLACPTKYYTTSLSGVDAVGTDVLVVGHKDSEGKENYPFVLKSDGSLTATKANITGTIRATTLYVGDNHTGIDDYIAAKAPTIDTKDFYKVGNTITPNNPGTDSPSFLVSTDGLLTAHNAVIYGTIHAGKGDIGNWSIDVDRLLYYDATNKKWSILSPAGVSLYTTAAGTSVNLALGIGTPTAMNFGVTPQGKLYATDAVISGYINGTSGKFKGDISGSTGSFSGSVTSSGTLGTSKLMNGALELNASSAGYVYLAGDGISIDSNNWVSWLDVINVVNMWRGQGGA